MNFELLNVDQVCAGFNINRMNFPVQQKIKCVQYLTM